MNSEEKSENQATYSIQEENKISQIYHLQRFEESEFSRFKKKLNDQKKKFQKKAKDPVFYKDYLLKRIPILDWLPKYTPKSSILPDLIAGSTVGIMNIPQV